MNVTTTIEPLLNSPDLTESNLGKIDLLTGMSVLSLVDDHSFIAEWHELYSVCPWATIFQTPDFVVSWYKHYASKHTPILVLSRHEGKLTGLLPLAQGIKELGIAGAGGHDAYYHMWLSAPVHGEAFIQAALKLLLKQFPGQDICLKYIPNNVPMKWVLPHGELSRHCALRDFSRPLLNLGKYEREKLLSKRSYKEKYNRIKKLGTIEFEVVTELAAFDEILDQLADQYDFRKAATLNIMPFRDDPSKREFLLDLFRRNVLMAAVLKANGNIISGITATTCENGWSHGAGINTHAPAFSSYSPGYLIMKLLSLALKDAGVTMFDITPGGHAYKEAHADDHDDLLELRVTSPYRALFLKQFFNVKAFLKIAMEKRGMNARQLRKDVNTQFVIMKEKLTRANSMSAPKNRTKNVNAKTTHIIPHKQKQLPTVTIVVNKDCLKDILSYNPIGSNLTRWEFMKKAMKYYEDGFIPYTSCEGNQLNYLVWLAPQCFRNHSTGIQEVASSLPTGSLMLCDINSFSKASENLTTFIHEVANELAIAFPAKNIYLIENIDFLPIDSTGL